MNIIGRRKIWFALSLLTIVLGIISMIYRTATVGTPLNLGIDFTGGNLISIDFKKPVSVQELRAVLKDYGLENSVIQRTGTNEVLIRTRVLDDREQAQVVKSFGEKIGPYNKDKLRLDKVGPVMGKELTRNALLALVIASVLITIYITFRFEFLFGIAAIIALLHDAFVTVGIFSIFWWEIDSSFVAAILTIIGYSINDTIVIFDRIRENLHKRKKDQDLETLVNDSVLQVMTRSINTVLMVVVVLLALLFFGGATVRNFTLALLIGTISGAYSSIFNASPLWVEFRNLARKRKIARA
ncbi:protein translocase subunit SecF [bacterium]|nr:MAG: protein translocase subunit SecF [bacterium]